MSPVKTQVFALELRPRVTISSLEGLIFTALIREFAQSAWCFYTTRKQANFTKERRRHSSDRGHVRRAAASWAVTCHQVVHDEAVHVRALHMQVVEFLQPLVFRDFVRLLCVTHSDVFLQEKIFPRPVKRMGMRDPGQEHTQWPCRRAGR